MAKQWKQLTNSDKERVVDLYRGTHSDRDLKSTPKWGSYEAKNSVAEEFEVTPRTAQNWFRNLGLTHSELPAQYLAAQTNFLPKSKRYFITWAQNATPIHSQFFENFLAYANATGATTNVILGRYKNPTSVFTDRAHEKWDSKVLPFATTARSRLANNYKVFADIVVQPTAVYPLSGSAMETMSGSDCLVIGHPKTHFIPCPVLQGEPQKYMMTTGACTIQNYTHSKAGAAGNFEHCIGFLILEVGDQGEVYPRQVIANKDDGSFYDLDFVVSRGKVSNSPVKTPGVVLGDIHAAKIEEPIFNATLDFLERFKPVKTITHDVFDGESISHHRKRDFVGRVRDYKNNKTCLRTELDYTYKVLTRLLPYNPVVVPANHNDWLDRWMNSNDWRDDLQNADIYAELLNKTLTQPDGFELFAYLVNTKFGGKIETTSREQSYRIEGVEVGQHGDIGIHGSRGNIKQYKKLPQKAVVGDYHKGTRLGGTVGVGVTASLRQGYNKGASAWNHAHAIIQPDGQVQLIIINPSTLKYTTLEDYAKIRKE